MSRGMAQVLATFTDVLSDDDGIRYRAQACGSEMPDGKWQGWVEFIPLDGSARSVPDVRRRSRIEPTLCTGRPGSRVSTFKGRFSAR